MHAVPEMYLNSNEGNFLKSFYFTCELKMQQSFSGRIESFLLCTKHKSILNIRHKRKKECNANGKYSTYRYFSQDINDSVRLRMCDLFIRKTNFSKRCFSRGEVWCYLMRPFLIEWEKNSSINETIKCLQKEMLARPNEGLKSNAVSYLWWFLRAAVIPLFS